MRIRYLAALAACACLVATSTWAQTGKPLSQADVTKINDSIQTFTKGALAKDWTTLSNMYTEDAVLNPPNEPPVKGRAAIRAWMEKYPPIKEFAAKTVRVEGRDDLAYVYGTYTMAVMPPGAEAAVKGAGKFLEVRRRQADGRWLIVVDIFNSDLPPPK